MNSDKENNISHQAKKSFNNYNKILSTSSYSSKNELTNVTNNIFVDMDKSMNVTADQSKFFNEPTFGSNENLLVI